MLLIPYYQQRDWRMRLWREGGQCSLFALYFEKEAVRMVNADRTGPEREHILSREERIRMMTVRENYRSGCAI